MAKIYNATEADLSAAVRGTAPSLKKSAKKHRKAVKAAKKELKAAGMLVKSAKPQPIDRAAEEWRILEGFRDSTDPSLRAMYREVFPSLTDVGARKFDEMVRTEHVNPFDQFNPFSSFSNRFLDRLYEDSVRKL